MKSRNIKGLLSVTAVSLLALVGCLKDKAFNNGEIQSFSGGNIKIISLGVQVSSTSPQFTTIAYDNSDNDTVVDFIPVELGGPVDAPTDIHVTVAQDDSVVALYNANNTDTTVTADNPNPTGNVTHFDVPTLFSIVNPGGVVVIPKGTRTGFLQIKFKPSDFIGLTLAIGFRVASVAETGYTISSNLNTGLISVVIKNKYDGSYTLRQQSIGWAAYGISDGPVNQWPSDVGLVSTGGSSVIFNTSATGSGEMGFTTAGGLTSFGATEPQFTFDLGSNLLTSVVNLIPNDGRNRQFKLNPAVTDSRFDPATKTVYLAYLFTQNGRPDQQIYDTLTYNGPR